MGWRDRSGRSPFVNRKVATVDRAGISILALTKYGRRAASTRQRLLQYEPFLKDHGISLKVSPLLDDAYLAGLADGSRASPMAIAGNYLERFRMLRGAGSYDLIWVQYELFPYLPGLFERLAPLRNKPIVYDLDDAIFHWYDDHSRRLVRTLLANKLAPLIRRASVCFCGNRYLLDYASRYCPNSIIVPTVVDTDQYMPRRDAGDPDAPVVGWIGSPVTWHFVEPVLPVIQSVVEKHGARLRAVGAGHAARGIEGLEAVEWTEESEIAEVQQMDIGIMPLKKDLFARGKCGYKLIQYMACGLPVVASPVGVNSEIVTHGVNGFLAETREEWAAALDRLLTDRALRLSLGQQGRERVVERYSLRSQQGRVFEGLMAALSGSAPANLRTML
jgi:glycosyltransferase involved in cell wall biosynthesis